MTLTLETDRLTLRRLATRDWPQVREFFMSERARAIGGPDSLATAWRAFATKLGHWEIHGYGMWTVTKKGDDTAIAQIGPWYPADWPEKEIGWLVFSDKAEGTGIAFEAARAAIHHAFGTLSWDTAVSYIAPDNTRSIALAERLGARLDPDAATPAFSQPHLVYRHAKGIV